MQTKILAIVLSAVCLVSGCVKKVDGGEAGNGSGGTRSGAAGSEEVSQKGPEPTSAVGASGEPRTIRDFYMLLPEKYFVLEGCEREKDKDCRRAKVDYLKTFTEVEDTANGYLKGGCDGGQRCLEMTIFKRPDGTYLVAVSTEGEMIIEQHFLDYDGGR